MSKASTRAEAPPGTAREDQGDDARDADEREGDLHGGEPCGLEAHAEGAGHVRAGDEPSEADGPWRSGVRGVAAPLDEARLAQWIERIVDRDERALTALYDATLSRVHGLVLRIVRRPQLAEEVVEDAYFQVWRQAARFDATRGRASAWLLGMARSRAIDALRHEARHAADSLDDGSRAEVPAEQPASDELLDLARSHAQLHDALMHLAVQPRQLVAMAFFRGLSHEEIAQQMALPLGTVKSQIRRALIHLRQTLGPALDGGAARMACAG